MTSNDKSVKPRNLVSQLARAGLAAVGVTLSVGGQLVFVADSIGEMSIAGYAFLVAAIAPWVAYVLLIQSTRGTVMIGASLLVATVIIYSMMFLSEHSTNAIGIPMSIMVNAGIVTVGRAIQAT